MRRCLDDKRRRLILTVWTCWPRIQRRALLEIWNTHAMLPRRYRGVCAGRSTVSWRTVRISRLAHTFAMHLMRSTRGGILLKFLAVSWE